MSLLHALGFGAVESRTVNTAITMADLLRLDDGWGGGTSAAGVRVTEPSALTVSAWWRGLDIRSGVLARIGPPRVLRRKGGGYAVYDAHPAARCVSRFRGNMTPFDFYKSRGVARLSQGSGYAWVKRSGPTPVEMIPLDARHVDPFRENDQDGYLYRPPDGSRPYKLPATDVFHMKGMSTDGGAGFVTWRVARNTLGAAIAMREHGSGFFARGARPGLLLKFPAKMDPVTGNKWLADFNRAYTGADKHFGAMILEMGLDVAAAPEMANANDSQLVESRVMEAREVANFLGVPAHYVGVPDTRTFSTAEQDEQSFINHTVDGDIVSTEQSLEAVLLTEDERASGEVVIRFDRSRLNQADLKSRAEATKAALAGVPWKSVNEERDALGLTPFADPKFDAPIIPINLVQAAKPGSPADPGATPPADPPPPAPDPTAMRFIAATRARMLDRLVKAVRAAAKKPDTFDAFVDGLRDAHEPTLREAFAPADGAHDTKGEVDRLFAAVGAACDRAQSSKPAEFAAAVERECAALESRR